MATRKKTGSESKNSGSGSDSEGEKNMPSWNECKYLLPKNADEVRHFIKHCIDWKERAGSVGTAGMRGNSALHYAIERVDVESVTLLLGSGADLSVRNSLGQTSQQFAQSMWFSAKCNAHRAGSLRLREADTKLMRINRFLARALMDRLVRRPISVVLFVISEKYGQNTGEYLFPIFSIIAAYLA